MSKPVLTIVAGCNGSGKSTFSHTLVEDGVIPFDYDKQFLKTYNSMFDSELRETMARNKTTQEFESSIKRAFLNGEDFCYETNFDSHPIFWAEKAKEYGYRLALHFYCLDNLELANARVAERTINEGHFVAKETVYYKWKEGYKNLNIHHELFDYILLVDNSSSDRYLTPLFAISKGKDIEISFFTDELPEYAERRFPDIYKIINN